MYRVFHLPTSSYLQCLTSKTDGSDTGPFPPDTVFPLGGGSPGGRWYRAPIPMNFYCSAEEIQKRIDLLISRNSKWKSFCLAEFELHNYSSEIFMEYTIEDFTGICD